MPPKPPSELAPLSVQDRALRDFQTSAPFTFAIASIADMVDPEPGAVRDRYLGNFWKTEPTLAGAVYSMCAKMAALDFKLEGPRSHVQKYKRILLAADLGVGNGWVNFIMKVTQDLLTQDNGSFIELLRAPGASANTAVRGIAHIDAQKCERTGNPYQPVVYHGKKDRKYWWYEVLPLVDQPSPREQHKGMGLCAVSRVLLAAQTLRSIGLYKRQKLAGKRTPGILFVQGVRRVDVQDAIDEALQEQLSEGLSVYTKPLVVTTMDTGVPLDAKLVELAGLPDGYSEDTTMKWYIANLALGFGTDYTEFAPLPGGNLGSATQATEMSARARGKGPGVLLQQLEMGVNYWILPEDTEFQFASTDPIAEGE